MRTKVTTRQQPCTVVRAKRQQDRLTTDGQGGGFRAGARLGKTGKQGRADFSGLCTFLAESFPANASLCDLFTNPQTH